MCGELASNRSEMWSTLWLNRLLNASLIWFPKCCGDSWRLGPLVASNTRVSRRLAEDSAKNSTGRRAMFSSSYQKALLPGGTVLLPRGNTLLPGGRILLPRGKILLPRGNTSLPRSVILLPECNVSLPAGKLWLPQATCCFGKRT